MISTVSPPSREIPAHILYTIVRIKSILNKYKEQGGDLTAKITTAR